MFHNSNVICKKSNGKPPRKVRLPRIKLRALSLVSVTLKIEYVTQFVDLHSFKKAMGSETVLLVRSANYFKQIWTVRDFPLMLISKLILPSPPFRKRSCQQHCLNFIASFNEGTPYVAW